MGFFIYIRPLQREETRLPPNGKETSRKDGDDGVNASRDAP